MKSFLAFILMATAFTASVGNGAESRWQQGVNYFLISPAQPKINPANVQEVTEAFSYGCPACNHFYPAMEKLKASLPAAVKVEYLPASFIPAESWPLFQRAYCTAQALGVAEKTHGEMFAAIWKNNELSTMDPGSHGLKDPPPRIENVAKFYNRVAGVDIAKFLATARSPAVDNCMQEADRMMAGYKVDSTPTIIVNGRYRLTPASAGGYDELLDLVKWLIARDSK